MTDSEIKRLLIFRPGHLGDTIVALPAIWSLKGNLPKTEFSYLYNIDRKNRHYITPRNVLGETGLVDRWIEYPFFEGQSAISRAVSKASLLLKLRRLKFDAVLYLMPRERTLRQVKRDIRFFGLAGIRRLIGVDHLIRSRFEENDPPASHRTRSESDFFIDCVTTEGFKHRGNENSDLLNISESEMLEARTIIQAPRDKLFIAVAPGSKRSSRMWDEDRFAEVLEQLVHKQNVFPIFFGSAKELDLCERIKIACGKGQNVAGKLSIRESAALLKCCVVYLGNDTGTMHLAAAVGTRCVAIFSAADRNGQWEPIGTMHKILRRNVQCEGCRIDVCPHENFCLRLIDSDEVYEKCVELIDQNKSL